jgi:hypothetical protein
MLRFVAPLPLLSGVFVACAGQTMVSPTDAGSVGDVRETEATGNATVARGDPDAASACAEFSDEARSAIATAIAAATADLHCESDSDCTVGPASSDCTFGCSGPVTTATGASAIQAAIDHANSTACSDFKRDGCPPPLPPPCPSGPMGAACLNGTCADFPPAAWESFSLDQQPGASGFTTPPSCTAKTSCTLWTVTADARVAVTDAQGTHQATLSASDFATVDGILRSVSFRQDLESGFSCDPSPGGQVISFDVTRNGGSEGMDVSGCVLTGPSGNDPQALYDVVKAY